jgi:hypothetical protein
MSGPVRFNGVAAHEPGRKVYREGEPGEESDFETIQWRSSRRQIQQLSRCAQRSAHDEFDRQPLIFRVR